MDFIYKQIGTGLGFGNNILENILKSRGIDNPKDFLNLGEHNLEDFHLFDNLQEAIKCFDSHIKNESKIAIIVDYDSDGYTSSSELYLYMQELCNYLSLKFNVEYIIHEKKEHGLTNDIMLKIESGKYNLVIVPDAGTNDYKQHNTLRKNNIDIIVIDHHQADKYSDDAIIINNQLSNKITDKELTGVGVVYKFCKALDEYYNISFADNYLDLFSFGMIADSAPLINLESRYLVLKGLKLIQDGTNKNAFVSRIFKEKAFSMSNKVTINSLHFYMCPFINCIIRGGDIDDKINLFKAFIGTNETFQDKIRGKGIVDLSIQDYMARRYTKLKKIQDEEISKGVEILTKQIDDYQLNKNEIIVVNGQELTNSEYNRVIVNKLTNIYMKHCILLKLHNNKLKGSAAGVKNKDIDDLRIWCKDSKLFDLAEGHPMAFGVEINSNNINALYEHIATIPSSDKLCYKVDAIFTEKTINKSIVNMISQYSDVWGNDLEEPIFALENIIVDSKDIMLLGKEKNTIKFKFNDVDIIKFKTSENEYNNIVLNTQNNFTIIGKFSVNQYGGNSLPQIIVENWKYEKSQVLQKFKF